jgi:hypothetical protein
MTARGIRLLTLLYVSSFLVLAAFPTFLVVTGTRIPGEVRTDHISHWSSTVLLGLYGLDIYRFRSEELCLSKSPEKVQETGEGGCVPYRHPSMKPLGVNWAQYPRVYPPGFALLGFVPALLRVFTNLTPESLNTIIIVEMLIAAHLASLAFFFCFREGLRNTGAERATIATAGLALTMFVVMPAVHADLMSDALYGFYDPLAILAVVSSMLLLRRERPVLALLVMSAAVFIHFRALWQLPILILAIMKTYDARKEWWRSRKTWGLIAMSAILLFISFYCFVTVLPALKEFPISNRFHFSRYGNGASWLFRECPLLVGVLIVLGVQRQWTTFALVAWQLVMLSQTREVQVWHHSFLLPILAAAALEKKQSAQAIAAVFLFIVWESAKVYNAPILNGQQLILYLESV